MLFHVCFMPIYRTGMIRFAKVHAIEIELYIANPQQIMHAIQVLYTLRLLPRIVSSDPRSTTCVNLRYLQMLSELDHPQWYSSTRIRLALPVKELTETDEKDY